METVRKEFKLGKIVVKGHKFEFRPEPDPSFSAKPGEEASFYVQYGYKEASREKETLELDFRIELDGVDLGTKQARVEDTRISTDEEWGLLKHTLKLNKKGTLAGTYHIVGLYTKGAWSGKGPLAETPFHHSASFTVRVR